MTGGKVIEKLEAIACQSTDALHDHMFGAGQVIVMVMDPKGSIWVEKRGEGAKVLYLLESAREFVRAELLPPATIKRQGT